MSAMPRTTLLSYPLDEHRYVNVLTIAGSDPSGGAGLQADLKTFASLRCYGMSIVTALTAQNTCGVDNIYSLPSTFIRQQLESVFKDIRVDAIKIGMLDQEQIINEVAEFLAQLGIDKVPPLVIDPVIYAKSGDQIINEAAIQVLKKRIVPLATVLTPNRQEACRLLGRQSIKDEDLEEAANELLKLGPKAVVIKGAYARDCLVFQGQENAIWLGQTADWIDTKNVHGTGCTFAAAISSFLARGDPLLTSIQKAKIYINAAIRAGASYQQGKGNGPVCHHWFPVEYDFIQIAWTSISDVYRRIKELPFLRELAIGTLPREKFDFFIQQDHLFLLERKAVCDAVVSRITTNDTELRSILTTIGENSRIAAASIFSKYNVKEQTIEHRLKSAVCAEYTNYLKNLAVNGEHVVQALVALVPCALIYQKMGECLKKEQQAAMISLENCYYQAWIDSYSNDERRQRVEKLVENVNKLVAAVPSSSRSEEFLNIFRRAAQYECEFWADAYSHD